MTYEEWYDKVCDECSKQTGFDPDDLPDYCYMDAFEDGLTPSEVLEDMLDELEGYECDFFF